MGNHREGDILLAVQEITKNGNSKVLPLSQQVIFCKSTINKFVLMNN